MIEQLFTLWKWPLIASLILPWLLVYLGLHIIRRGIIFVDLALAQVAALGTCLSILMGYDVHDWQSYVFSLGFTLIGAIIFTVTRTEQHRVPQEALIGIVYVVAAAAGILILNQSTGGKEELQRSLIGELLVVTRAEVLQTFGLFVLVGVVHFIFRARFMAISFEPEKAEAEGVSMRWWDFLFYALFGLVVTSFVHIGGVLLVFTYLIVPAVCAAYLADSLAARLAIGWGVATVASIGSLCVSVQANLPIGATIVCGLGILLVFIAAVAYVRHESGLTICQILFSFTGRIGRRTFWVVWIGMLILSAIVGGILRSMAEEKVMRGFLGVVWVPVAAWVSLAVQAKRWHDRARSAWMILINCIPIIGWIWALIELGFLSGTKGSNPYGEPRQERKA